MLGRNVMKKCMNERMNNFVVLYLTWRLYIPFEFLETDLMHFSENVFAFIFFFLICRKDQYSTKSKYKKLDLKNEKKWIQSRLKTRVMPKWISVRIELKKKRNKNDIFWRLPYSTVLFFHADIFYICLKEHYSAKSKYLKSGLDQEG